MRCPRFDAIRSFALFVLLLGCQAISGFPTSALADEKSAQPPDSAATASSAADDPDSRAVRQALDRKVTIRWMDVPLQDALQQLSSELEISVVLDRQALDDVGVAADCPLAFSLPQAKARHALRLLLEPLQLTFVVRHGVLSITSTEKASEILETRVYNVRDLVAPDRAAMAPVKVAARIPVPDGTKVIYDPSDRRREEEGWEDYDTLIDMLTSAVAPDSWTDNGGRGSVSGFRGLLVVSQTDEVHEEIQRLLALIRAAQDKPGVILPQP